MQVLNVLKNFANKHFIYRDNKMCNTLQCELKKKDQNVFTIRIHLKIYAVYKEEKNVTIH